MLTIQNAYTKMCNDSKNVTIVVRNSMALPSDFEEDPSCKSSCGQFGARVTNVAQNDRGIRQSPRHPDTKADYETKIGETI